jgi:hypothetical protein
MLRLQPTRITIEAAELEEIVIVPKKRMVQPPTTTTRDQENDETEAMRVFTEDPATETILAFLSSGQDSHASPVMDDTPPRETHLHQLLTRSMNLGASDTPNSGSD